VFLFRVDSKIYNEKQNYVLNSFVLIDIDECADKTDTCDINVICTNTPGSYTCQCKPGFSGNGKTCTGECSQGMDELVF
jgi:hypothetical protein